MHKKTSESIKKENKSLHERGLHNNSFFIVKFQDGSDLHEKDCNWRDFSEMKRVQYLEGTKSVMLSKHKIKHIHVQHNDKMISLDVPEGCEVYQAVRSETMFVKDQSKQSRIVGRVVGFVKDGDVVQEIFINGLQDVVLGFKK